MGCKLRSWPPDTVGQVRELEQTAVLARVMKKMVEMRLGLDAVAAVAAGTAVLAAQGILVVVVVAPLDLA